MFFDAEYIKHRLKYPFSKKSRKFINNYNYKNTNLKLIMTYLVKNEEEIIEKVIRFHKAMGVDGFIVTSHNSTDRTNEILERLKKEGLILEIIYETNPKYLQVDFCDRMIKLAKNKYKADWVISSDADEFYYSDCFNLKESISEYDKCGINLIKLRMLHNFPDNKSYFLKNYYYIVNTISDFAIKKLNITDSNILQICAEEAPNKVIIKTKNYKKIAFGNHSCKMYFKKSVLAGNIKFFHYHMRDYKSFEQRVHRWKDTAFTLQEGAGFQEKFYVDLYEKGKLKEYYDSLYSEETRNFLLHQGVVVIDKSVPNFLEQLNLID